MIRPSTLIASLALCAPVLAAELRVECRSASAPGSSLVRVSGDPGLNVLLYVRGDDPGLALSSLLVPAIAPLRDGPNNLMLGGTLDASGRADFSFAAQPGLAGHHLRFVARSGTPLGPFSNTCRKSYLAPESCGEASSTAQALSLFGDLFPLADGRMLAIGGAGPLVTSYDSVAEATGFAGLLPVAPTFFQARAQLADGRVLCFGGIDQNGAPIADATLFDPTDGSTSSVGPMLAPRAGAAAARLANGKVLIVGGLSTIDLTDPTTFFDGILGTSELFDPATNTFTAGPTLVERKAFATATLLNNGQVLVAGGLGVLPIVNLPFVSNTGYLYNTNNTFGIFPKLFTDGRMFHSATKLADGRVLLTGGITADLGGVLDSGDPTQIAFTTLGTSAVFATTLGGSFSNGPALAETRAFHTATKLVDGRVLVAGGFSGTLDIGAILSGDIQLPAALATTEFLTAATRADGPALSGPRAGASALLDPNNGRVVIVGGGPTAVELFQP